MICIFMQVSTYLLSERIMKRESTEVRQKQIKKAVLEIIAEKGLHNVSTRNLAKQVGLSEGALFRHFPTKRAIIKGIMDDVASDLIGSLREIALSSKNVEEKLFDFLCRNVQYLKKNKGITILLFSEATHLGDEELKDALNKILTAQKQFVNDIIRQGISEGICDENLNPEDVALLYMGIPITLNIELVLNKNNFNSDNFCKRMYSVMMKAIKK